MSVRPQRAAYETSCCEMVTYFLKERFASSSPLLKTGSIRRGSKHSIGTFLMALRKPTARNSSAAASKLRTGSAAHAAVMVEKSGSSRIAAKEGCARRRVCSASRASCGIVSS